MKKKLLLTLISSVVFCLGANAQASSYGFSAIPGSYAAISGGSLVAAPVADQYSSTSLILSPGFLFAGVTYTNAYMTSNGLLNLGGTTAPGTAVYNGIAGTTGSGITLCPFGADLISSTMAGVTPSLRFETVGNEHIFQWNDMSRFTTGGTERFSFQVRLNTTTNVIRFVYDITAAGTIIAYQPAVGIRTSPTDFRSLTVGTGTMAGIDTWENPNIANANTDLMRFTAAAPAKTLTPGQTYIWTPPTCTVPAFPTLTISAISFSSATLSWLPGGNESLWIVENSAPTTSAVVSTPSYVITSLTPSAAYSINVRAYCGVGDTSVRTRMILYSSLCKPPAITSTLASAVCVSGTINLQATTATSATLNWYTAATGGVATSTNPSFSTPNLTTTTIYYVSATGTLCEGPRTPVVAKVNARPYIVAVSSATRICAGSNVNLVASGPSTTFTWFPNGGHLNSANVSPNTTTTYSVAGENTPGCASFATISVIVNPAPLVSASVINPAICSGETASLSVIGNAVNYNWLPEGGIATDAFVTPTVTSTYSVTGHDALGCTSSATLEITVNAAPSLLAGTSKTLACPGEPVTLFATTDATSFIWSNSANTLSTTVNPTGSTTYSINASNGVCSSVAFVSITVDACTKINKVAADNGFNIYPQPVSDLVTITIPAGTQSTIRIFDVVGKLVISQELTREVNTVNVNTLHTGVYFYKISDANTELKTGKIIKN